jgi:hypothetical protein
MLTIPMPAVASHNVIQTTVSVWEDDGELDRAEFPEEVATEYHVDAKEDGLIPEARQMPQDDTGSHYTGECKPYEEYTSDEAYQEALTSEDGTAGEACYIGYFEVDHQLLLLTSGFIFSADLLYPVNSSDPYCQGEEDAQKEDERTLPVAGVEPVDEAAARAERAPSSDCDGSGHAWELDYPQALAIDDDLLEAPAQSGEADPVAENHGTSAKTIPGIFSGYGLLFGQPHPATEEPSELRAGEGPFSTAPGNLGDPDNGLSTMIAGDLSNACGDRTQECRLLTPEDVRNYDNNRPDVGGDDQARICTFSPQFVATDPADFDAGLCGVTGDGFVWDEYRERGGLGLEDGPPTYVSTTPGWHYGRIPIETPYVSAGLSYNPAGGNYTNAYYYYNAVNPSVPESDHPLWCVVPGMLTEPGQLELENGNTIDDPGLYGTYDAHAISTHVRHFTVAPLLDQVADTVGPTLRDVQNATDEADDTIDNSTPDLPGVPGAVTDLVNDTTNTTSESMNARCHAA